MPSILVNRTTTLPTPLPLASVMRPPIWALTATASGWYPQPLIASVVPRVLLGSTPLLARTPVEVFTANVVTFLLMRFPTYRKFPDAVIARQLAVVPPVGNGEPVTGATVVAAPLPEI